MQRASETGRIVPPDAIGSTHYGANETIRHLVRQYKRDPGVNFSIVDNTGSEFIIRDARRLPVLKEGTVQQQSEQGVRDALQEASDEIRESFQRYLRPQSGGSGLPAGVESGEAAQRTSDLPSVRSSAVEPGDGTTEAYRFGGLSAAAQAEAARLSRQLRTEPGTYGKVLSAWKTTQTVFNPPSWVRNFYQREARTGWLMVFLSCKAKRPPHRGGRTW
ncbi:MAG: hypothetical protein ACP5RN_03435 [Armatimonadota bacterium]